jgi:nitrate/nitrite transporter NarK
MIEQNTNVSVSPYRWVVLAIYMLVTAVSQIMWMTFAPIARDAAAVYTGGNIDQIDLLAMLAMFSWLPFAIPASWCIDRFGLKWGSGIGVILIGLCGFMRIFAPNYAWLLVCMIGCAIAQPFVLNAFTKLAANWFPEKEEALSSGLLTMSIFIGFAIHRFHPRTFPNNRRHQAGHRHDPVRLWNTGPYRDDTVSCFFQGQAEAAAQSERRGKESNHDDRD